MDLFTFTIWEYDVASMTEGYTVEHIHILKFKYLILNVFLCSVV